MSDLRLTSALPPVLTLGAQTAWITVTLSCRECEKKANITVSGLPGTLIVFRCPHRDCKADQQAIL